MKFSSRRMAAVALSISLLAGSSAYAAPDATTGAPVSTEASLAETTEASSQSTQESSAEQTASSEQEAAWASQTEPETTQVELETQSVAGVAVALDAFNTAKENGQVDTSVEVAIVSMIDENASSVLEQYSNLGIASVNNYLNVRETPKKSGEIIGKMIRNSACNIVGEEDGWYQIESGAVKGYVSKEYILTGDEAKKIALDEAKLCAIVTTESNLNVRESASTDSKKITKICTNERYEVLSQQDGWIEISLEGNDESGELNTGFIAGDYADVRYALVEAYEFSPISSSSSVRNNIVNYALEFLGNPYVWGGTSLTKGADCSGFVKSVFRNYGISLPRTSRTQANAGTKISSSEMQPGDLVFYGSPINHVAIYMGNGKIVHAANPSKGIIISRWNYMTPVKIVNVLGNK